VEVDEIAVPEAVWQKACEGDVVARQEIGKIINGLELYFHAMGIPEDWTVIKLTDLEKARIYVTVKVSLLR
jgi:hypothetical protein